MPLAEIDLTVIFVALIGAVPATIAAWASLQAKRALKTPSGTSVGKQVESVHHTALANNYRLQALGGELDIPMPDNAAAQEAHVDALNEVKTKAQRAANG